MVEVEWDAIRSPKIHDLKMEAKVFPGLRSEREGSTAALLDAKLRDIQGQGNSVIYFIARDTSPDFEGVERPCAYGLSCSPATRVSGSHQAERLLLAERCYAAAPTAGDRVYRRLMKKGSLSEKEAQASLDEQNLYRSALYRK